VPESCPQCGTARVGAFRFCRGCGLDFDALDATAPAAPADSFASTQVTRVAPVASIAPAAPRPTGGRVTRRGVVLGGVGVLVALMAIGSLQPPDPGAPTTALASATPGATVDPTPDPTPEPSAEPTSEPTPEPTVEPTVEPTPEPTATISKAQKKWTAFTTHVSGSSTVIGDRLHEFSTAATEMDFSAIEANSKSLKRLATDELNWLGDHPPAECYATVHKLYTSGLKKLLGAANSMLKFMDTFDVDYVYKATDALTSGTEILQETTAELYLVDCS